MGSRTTASDTSATGASKSPPLSAWQARTLHEIQLPSGQWVRIRIPGMATLLEKGALPEDLIALALMELTQEGGATAKLAQDLAGAENGDREQALAEIAKYARFQRELARDAIREVKAGDEWAAVSLSMEDTLELPEDDLAMVAEIAQRLRFYDARGVRIGVEPLDRWNLFREKHKGVACTGDEDCPACRAIIDAVSTAYMG